MVVHTRHAGAGEAEAGGSCMVARAWTLSEFLRPCPGGIGGEVAREGPAQCWSPQGHQDSLCPG